MDTITLLAVTDFSRARLLGTLDAIEKAAGADVGRALAWRPAPGRAHVAWQAMHCAATHDRYLNVLLRGTGAPKDRALCDAFAGGSTPSDDDVPGLATIRATLARTFDDYRAHVAGLDANALARVQAMPNGTTRTVAESITLLAWHEAHHQGQIHLTWNCYQAKPR